MIDRETVIGVIRDYLALVESESKVMGEWFWVASDNERLADSILEAIGEPDATGDALREIEAVPEFAWLDVHIQKLGDDGGYLAAIVNDDDAVSEWSGPTPLAALQAALAKAEEAER